LRRLGRELQAREALGRAAALDPSSIAVAPRSCSATTTEGDLPRAHAGCRGARLRGRWIVLGDYPGAPRPSREALGAYAHALDLDPALRATEHARKPCECSADTAVAMLSRRT
jgi:hypothetical protein